MACQPVCVVGFDLDHAWTQKSVTGSSVTVQNMKRTVHLLLNKCRWGKLSFWIRKDIMSFHWKWEDFFLVTEKIDFSIDSIRYGIFSHWRQKTINPCCLFSEQFASLEYYFLSEKSSVKFVVAFLPVELFWIVSHENAKLLLRDWHGQAVINFSNRGDWKMRVILWYVGMIFIQISITWSRF